MRDSLAGGRPLEPELRSAIGDAEQERRRRIAIAVARFALAAPSTTVPALEEALARCDETGAIDPSLRRVVRETAERLDDLYLDLYDEEKPGGRSDGWEPAFRLARAAAACLAALDDEPTSAALNATYEA